MSETIPSHQVVIRQKHKIEYVDKSWWFFNWKEKRSDEVVSTTLIVTDPSLRVDSVYVNGKKYKAGE